MCARQFRYRVTPFGTVRHAAAATTVTGQQNGTGWCPHGIDRYWHFPALNPRAAVIKALVWYFREIGGWIKRRWIGRALGEVR
jgi:hypothetical protein